MRILLMKEESNRLVMVRGRKAGEDRTEGDEEVR